MNVCSHFRVSTLFLIYLLFGNVDILQCLHALRGPVLHNACRFSQFRCHEGTNCLETEKLCNGIQDCPFGEDEKGNEQYDCTRSTLSDDCPSEHFRCRFGGCIKNELRCNGVPDCWGGTDEAFDFCNIDPQKLRKRVKKPNQISSAMPKKTTTAVHICTQTGGTHSQEHNVPDPATITHPVPSVGISSAIYPHSSPSQPPNSAGRKHVTSTSTVRSESDNRMHHAENPSFHNFPIDERFLEEDFHPQPKPMDKAPMVPPPTQTYPPPPLPTPYATVEVSSTSRQASQTDQITCPPIELQLGEKVSCFQQRLAQEIQCEEHVSPEGTRAEISCQQFWSPPETGPSRTFKRCKNGEWQGGTSDFICELDCGSGGTAPSPYVTGGQPSEQGKWPWHAGLYENNPPGSSTFQQICGATLVTRQTVLTAAHCVTFPSTNQKRNEASLRVYLGKYFRPADKNNEYVQSIAVNKIVVHHKYNYAQLENDIALLRLQQPIDVTAFVHPVCMPFEDADGPYVGDEGILAGWGSIGDREYPDELREAKLPVRSNRECIKNSPVLANLVRETTFCAGHRNGTAACDGDSGGGLVFRDEYSTNKFKIFGVVSGGVPRAGGRGCDPNYFVAFSKVSSFRKWIDRVLDSFAHLF